MIGTELAPTAQGWLSKINTSFLGERHFRTQKRTWLGLFLMSRCENRYHHIHHQLMMSLEEEEEEKVIEKSGWG